MKINKNLLIPFSIIMIFLSCEKDDICIEEITPYLIIRFYDIDSPNNFKKVANIRVELAGIEGFYEDDELTIKPLTDSIAIPIKVTDDITGFKLTISELDVDDNLIDNQDNFELFYDRENIYVSRSCGYKTVYNNVTFQLEDDNDNWVKEMEATESPLNITNQTSAHVKIYN